ncbi:MAG: hypothetical protein AAFX44_09660 [Pseudomonadota bacterium]
MLDPASVTAGLVLGVLATRLAGSLIVRRYTLVSDVSQRLAPDQSVRWLRRALDRAREDVARREESLSEFRNAYEQRARELAAMREDVRDAVKLTRQLRSELIERVHRRIVAERFADATFSELAPVPATDPLPSPAQSATTRP